MSRIAVSDRKATTEEVRAHASSIRRLARELGLGRPKLRDDGTLVVLSEEPGYRSVTRLSAAASGVVGAYVHVISDDAPGGAAAGEM